MAGAAAEARAFQLQVVPEDVQQRRRRVRLDLVRLSIDPQGDQAFPFSASFTRGITCSAISCIERLPSFGSTQSWQG